MRVVGLSKMAADSINCYGPAASPLIQVSGPSKNVGAIICHANAAAYA